MENPLAGDQRCGDLLAPRQSIYRAYSTYTNLVAGIGDSNAARSLCCNQLSKRRRSYAVWVDVFANWRAR
jgi:hypothetical protein